MRIKLLWILLGASLLLNLFFAGGVIYSKMTAERLRGEPGRQFDLVAAELELSEAQRAELMALSDAARERRQEMRLEGEHLRQALIEEMGKPALDQARVQTLLGERSKLFVTFVGDVMAETHNFLDTLEPEKKREFLALMERDHRFLWRLLRDPQRDKPEQP
ncbi:MAG TPA: periplasmic heavy metal sensor [Acidobacteriota bacterium]